MPSTSPKSKWDKQCPVCSEYINSKGFANHVRAHGVNPESIDPSTHTETSKLIGSSERALREKLESLRQDDAKLIARLERNKADEKQLEEILKAYTTARETEPQTV